MIMVEYFGEHIDGLSLQNGWVQELRFTLRGKPPIDGSIVTLLRPAFPVHNPLTDKPVKKD